MSDDSEEIDRALSELASLVGAQMRGAGWVRRDLDQRHVLVLTKPTRDGVFATVEVELASYRWPQTWPEMITVEFGAGYEPALDLMPLVTLRPRVSLASESAMSDEPNLEFEIVGADKVAEAALKLMNAIHEKGTRFAERYDVNAFETALTDREQWPYDLEAELRPVLLASAGRSAQARSALHEYLDSDTSEFNQSGYQRFARQLTRWLDAGNPPPPPIEQTLRRLPPPPPKPQGPSLSRVRQENKNRSAARDAVRAVARDKTREQISELLAVEHAARGVDIAPSAAAYGAEIIELEQQPFGKLRGLVHGLKTLAAGAIEGINMVRGRTPPNPDWMQPPPRATYLVTTRHPFSAVVITPGADAVLARAATEATRRVGPNVLLDVWLDTDADQHVRVHLGEQEIGTLPAKSALAFATDLSTATELFDESLRVRATLTPASLGRPALLEIGIPKHAI